MKKFNLFFVLLCVFFGKTFGQDTLLHENFEKNSLFRANHTVYDKKAKYFLESGKLIIEGQSEVEYILPDSIYDKLKDDNIDFDVQATFHVKNSFGNIILFNYGNTGFGLVVGKQCPYYVISSNQYVLANAWDPVWKPLSNGYNVFKKNILRVKKRGKELSLHINGNLVNSTYFYKSDKIGFYITSGKVAIDDLSIVTFPTVTRNEKPTVVWQNLLDTANLVIKSKKNKFTLSFNVYDQYALSNIHILHNGKVIDQNPSYPSYYGNTTISKDVNLELGTNYFSVLLSEREGNISPTVSSNIAYVDYQYDNKNKHGFGVKLLGFENGLYKTFLDNNWLNNINIYYQRRTKTKFHNFGFENFNNNSSWKSQNDSISFEERESRTFIYYSPVMILAQAEKLGGEGFFGRNIDLHRKQYFYFFLNPFTRIGLRDYSRIVSDFNKTTYKKEQFSLLHIGAGFGLGYKLGQWNILLNVLNVHYANINVDNYNKRWDYSFEVHGLNLFYCF